MSKCGIGTSDELLQNCKTNTVSVHCYGHKNRVLIFHYMDDGTGQEDISPKLRIVAF